MQITSPAWGIDDAAPLIILFARFFSRWLKKKNADVRRQQSLERQRSKMYRVQVKRSRKTQALVRALKESQAFRYVDYYGYRY